MTASSQALHTNRLIHATSPYLLQHAHNPVDWYPWGAEALERAKKEDRPIFLSIGYAACHWCHVMEHESFENEEIARVLNEHFVCIKVDREERPDLDDLYMKATQVYNQGGGGWPMSVFLLPDGKPFFAGTYFPPESRWGRPGFKDLLEMIARLWKQDRAKINAGADSLTSAVREISQVEHGDAVIPAEAVARATQALAKHFDREYGGLSGGGTNKFPPSMAMDLMLREYHHSLANGAPKKEYLELVELTLDHMARGGIYDQLGGGFARYSTDVHWLVPHFEKMLYDQALVSGIYLDAYQVTGKPLYARIVRETLDYVIGDLQSPEGGYYCTRDADSEGVEGKYYVWSHKEVGDLLGSDAELFCTYYDVTEAGNWEHHNILQVEREPEAVAKQFNLSVNELEQRLATGRRKLLDTRSKRVPPHLDDKTLTSWNGLMIASMARAYRVLEEPRYRNSAVRAARCILEKLRRPDGRLLRTYRKGQAHTLAYLDDYAFFIEGLISLYEVTGEIEWLDHAIALNTDVTAHFADAAGGYFFTPNDGEALLVRGKDASDNAIPSGNSVQLMNLLRLAELTGDKKLLADAEKLMRCFQQNVAKYPAGSERLLAGVDYYWHKPVEIALVTPVGADDSELQRALWRTYVPNKIVATLRMGTPQADALPKRVPLLADRRPIDGKPTAYVCRNFVCKAPITDAKALVAELTGQ